MTVDLTITAVVAAIAFVVGVWFGIWLLKHVWLKHAIDTGVLDTGRGQYYTITRKASSRK